MPSFKPIINSYLYFFGVPALAKRIRYETTLSLIKRYKIGLKNKKILDVGGAPGDFSFFLAENYSPQEIVCVDSDGNRLKSAIKIIQKGKYPNIKIIHKNIFKFTPQDTYFSIVFCLDIIEHIKNDVAFLKHLYSLLEPHGKLILSFPSKNRRINPVHESAVGHVRDGYDRKEIIEKLNATGFQLKTFRYVDSLDLAYYFYILKSKITKALVFPFLYWAVKLSDIFLKKQGSMVVISATKNTICNKKNNYF